MLSVMLSKSCVEVFRTNFGVLGHQFSSAVKRLRIERIIANSGVGSRSEVTKLLRMGKVTVDGVVIRGSSNVFPVNANIMVNGIPLDRQTDENLQVLVYNKPVGVLSTIGDPSNRRNLKEVYSAYPNLLHSEMHPVGRLDRDTNGLMIFTNDGDLTSYLLHPKSKVEREYSAVVLGHVNNKKLGLKLAEGISTTDGIIHGTLLNSREVSLEEKASWFPDGITVHKSVLETQTGPQSSVNTVLFQNNDSSIAGATDVINNNTTSSTEQIESSPKRPGEVKTFILSKPGQITRVSAITKSTYLSTPEKDDENDTPNSNTLSEVEVKLTPRQLAAQPLSTLNLVVTEGKYRMVRRILHNAGHSVVGLKRVRYGEINLLHTSENNTNNMNKTVTRDNTATASTPVVTTKQSKKATDRHKNGAISNVLTLSPVTTTAQTTQQLPAVVPLVDHPCEGTLRELSEKEMDWVKGLCREIKFKYPKKNKK